MYSVAYRMLPICTATWFQCSSFGLHDGGLHGLVLSRTSCPHMIPGLTGLISLAVLLGPFIQTCTGEKVICNQASQAQAAILSLRTWLRSLTMLPLSSSSSTAGMLCLPHNLFMWKAERASDAAVAGWQRCCVSIVPQCNARQTAWHLAWTMSTCLSWHLPNHENPMLYLSFVRVAQVSCGRTSLQHWCPWSRTSCHHCWMRTSPAG